MECRKGEIKKEERKKFKKNETRSMSTKPIKQENNSKGKAKENISKLFPNFMALTEEERLAFFEALSAARKNVEKSGAPTRQRFGTVHDEYLTYFNECGKAEIKNAESKNQESKLEESNVTSHKAGENPQSCLTLFENLNGSCLSADFTEPSGDDKSSFEDAEASRLSKSIVSESMKECETILKKDRDEIVNLFLDKKKRINMIEKDNKSFQALAVKKGLEEKSIRVTKTEQSISPSDETLKLKNKENIKPKKEGPNNPPAKFKSTPKFDALNQEERKIFFNILQEARENILEKHPEKKSEILSLGDLLRKYDVYNVDNSSFTNLYSTTVVEKLKEIDIDGTKNLKVKVTVTSPDNARIEKSRFPKFDDDTSYEEEFKRYRRGKREGRGSRSSNTLRSKDQASLSSKDSTLKEGEAEEPNEIKPKGKGDDTIKKSTIIKKDTETQGQTEKENKTNTAQSNKAESNKPDSNKPESNKPESSKTENKAESDALKSDSTKEELKKGDSNKADNTKADNTKTDNTKTDNTKTDNTKTDNTKSDNTKTDNTKADNTKADNTKSDNTKADNTKVDNTKTDNTKVDNTKTDNTKTDNTKTDNTKTDNTKAEDNKDKEQNKKKEENEKKADKERENNDAEEIRKEKEAEEIQKEVVERRKRQQELESKKMKEQTEEEEKKQKEEEERKQSDDPEKKLKQEIEKKQKEKELKEEYEKLNRTTLAKVKGKKGKVVEKKKKPDTKDEPPKNEDENTSKPAENVTTNFTEIKKDVGDKSKLFLSYDQIEEVTNEFQSPTENKSTENKSTENKTTENKSTENKSSEKKPAKKAKQKGKGKNAKEKPESSSRLLTESGEKKPKAKKQKSNEQTKKTKKSKKDKEQKEIKDSKADKESKTDKDKNSKEKTNEKVGAKDSKEEGQKPDSKQQEKENSEKLKNKKKNKKSQKNTEKAKKVSEVTMCVKEDPKPIDIADQCSMRSCEMEDTDQSTQSNECCGAPSYETNFNSIMERSSNSNSTLAVKSIDMNECQSCNSTAEEDSCVSRAENVSECYTADLKNSSVSGFLARKSLGVDPVYAMEGEDINLLPKTLKAGEKSFNLVAPRDLDDKSSLPIMQQEVIDMQFPEYRTGKVVLVDDGVIEKIRALVRDLERKAKTDNNEMENEYLRMLLDYMEYLSNILEKLTLLRNDKPQFQHFVTVAEAHLKFDENPTTLQKAKKPKEEPKLTDAPPPPRSISETATNVIAPPQSEEGSGKSKKSKLEAILENSGSKLSLQSSESISEIVNSEELIAREAALVSKQKQLPTTKVRLLQDLLKERAQFVEGSIVDFKIVHLPQKEKFVPTDKSEKAVELKAAEDEHEEKKSKWKFFKAVAKFCRCGKKEAKEEDNVLENLKGEAVAVDVTEDTGKDPASVTLNDSTMEVLKAAGRKQLIQKYYRNT